VIGYGNVHGRGDKVVNKKDLGVVDIGNKIEIPHGSLSPYQLFGGVYTSYSESALVIHSIIHS
jgi:hypothetical protein